MFLDKITIFQENLTYYINIICIIENYSWG